MEPYSKARSNSVTVRRLSQQFVNGVGQGEYSLYTYTEAASAVLNGWKDPDWRVKVSAHRPATTPCSGYQVSFDPGYCYSEAQRYQRISSFDPYLPSVLYTAYGDIGGSAVPVISLPPNLGSVDNVALTRFYDSISSRVSQANALTTLGELRSTVQQLKHPFRAMRNLLTSREKSLKGRWNRMNRVRSVKARKILGRDFQKAAAGTWLEVQFGLRPLVSDIADFHSYLINKKFALSEEYFPVRGKSNQLFQESFQAPVNLGFPISTPRWYLQQTNGTKLSVRYIGQIHVDPVGAPWTKTDVSRLGLGLKDFIPTLWEITPWSFLIDYFTNFGELINSFSVPVQNVAWINKTRRSENYRLYFPTGSNSGIDYGPNFYVVPHALSSVRPSNARSTQFERVNVKPQALTRPNISFDLPDGFKMANILALCLSDSRRRFSNPRS